MKRTTTAAALLTIALGATACGGDDGGGSSSDDLATKGPIKIWLSNNPEELAWARRWWRTGTPPTRRRR